MPKMKISTDTYVSVLQINGRGDVTATHFVSKDDGEVTFAFSDDEMASIVPMDEDAYRAMTAPPTAPAEEAVIEAAPEPEPLPGVEDKATAE